METLKETNAVRQSRLIKIHGEGAVKRRIMDMGITKNVEIYVRKIAAAWRPD